MLQFYRVNASLTRFTFCHKRLRLFQPFCNSLLRKASSTACVFQTAQHRLIFWLIDGVAHTACEYNPMMVLSQHSIVHSAEVPLACARGRAQKQTQEFVFARCETGKPMSRERPGCPGGRGKRKFHNSGACRRHTKPQRAKKRRKTEAAAGRKGGLGGIPPRLKPPFALGREHGQKVSMYQTFDKIGSDFVVQPYHD